MYLELSPRLPSSDERSVQTFATRIRERAGVTIGRLRGAAHPPRRYPCRQQAMTAITIDSRVARAPLEGHI